MKQFLSLFVLLALAKNCIAQQGWTVCAAPNFTSRVDDIFMINSQTGYAVSGDGKIVKTTNGGDNWTLINQTAGIYCRSVEFVDAQVGFVGGFPNAGTANVFRRTSDGGNTWTDLTPQIHARARRGICGIAVADKNTIYACGNWFQDSAYIIKSTDGGNTWNFIDMHSYATSIIDMHFVSKDTGFAVGKGTGPVESGLILYTTNGGQSWTKKFEGITPNQYGWKIQQLTRRIYFVALEDLTAVPAKILRSEDGGMTWNFRQVSPTPYNVEGVGFLNTLQGWVGGGPGKSFQTRDGGVTWDSIAVCPMMNRVVRVNDSVMLASGSQIWKFRGNGVFPPVTPPRYASMVCFPNPVKDILTIDVGIEMQTRVSLILMNASGHRIRTIENADRPKGTYHYYVNTSDLTPGVYFVSLKTHEDKGFAKIIVSR